MRGLKEPILVFLNLVLFFIPILVLSFMANPFGIGISPDSVNYLSASKSLITSGDFIGFDGTLITHWPPLFPIILASINLLGINPIDSMPYINGLILGLSSLLTFYFVRSKTQSLDISILAGFLVSTGLPLLFVSGMLWSEPIFILLILLSFVFLTNYLKKPSSANLVFLGVVCAAAFLQRYSGITLILSSSLIMLFFLEKSLRVRIIHILLFGVISCLPVATWILRNLIINGTLSGERYYSVDKLFPSIKNTFIQIGAFFIPEEFSRGHEIFSLDLYSLMVFSVGVSILIFASFLVLRNLLNKNNQVDQESSTIALFLITYTSFIVYAQLTACCAQRLVAPLYPVIIILFSISVHKLINRNKHRGYKNIVFILLFVILSFSTLNTVIMVKRALYYNENGLSIMNGKYMRHNMTIKHLNELIDIDETCVYTNAAPEISFLANIQCVRMAAEKKRFYLALPVDTRDKMIDQIIKESSDKVLFVWINNIREDRFYDIDSLRDVFEVIKLFESNDGIVYELVINH